MPLVTVSAEFFIMVAQVAVRRVVEVEASGDFCASVKLFVATFALGVVNVLRLVAIVETELANFLPIG